MMLTEEEELTLQIPFCNLSKEYKMFLQNSSTFPFIKNPLDRSKCIVILDYQKLYPDQFCTHEERFNKIQQCLWVPRACGTPS